MAKNQGHVTVYSVKGVAVARRQLHYTNITCFLTKVTGEVSHIIGLIMFLQIIQASI